MAHSMGQVTEVDCVPGTGRHNGELLFAFKGDKLPSKVLCVGVDVEAELGEDGKPDIFWSEDEMAVLRVRPGSRTDEAISGCDDLCWHFLAGAKR